MKLEYPCPLCGTPESITVRVHGPWHSPNADVESIGCGCELDPSQRDLLENDAIEEARIAA